MNQFITSDNHLITFTKEGSGKPLLMVHGWGCDNHHFDTVVPTLSLEFEVIRFDLRSMGSSKDIRENLSIAQMAKDLNALIETLGYEKVNLLGWSMGVCVIYDYIRQFGCEKIEKTVLVEMTPKNLTEGDWNLGFCDNNINMLLLYSMSSNWKNHCLGAFYGVFADGANSPFVEEMKWSYLDMLECDPLPLIALWIDLYRQDYRDMLGEITVPCALFFGEKGQTKIVADYLREHIKDSKVVLFENAAHAIHVEAREKYCKEVVDYLK